jgi:Flp pilus assembly protein TadD
MKEKIDSREIYEKVVLEALELYHQSEYSKALEKFLRLAEYNFQNMKVHEMLGYIYLKLDLIQKAEEEYEILMKLAKEKNIEFKKPTFEELVEAAGDEGEALRQFEALEASGFEDFSPEETKVVINLGLIYMAKGKYREAEKIFEKHHAQLSALREKKIAEERNT